jgi:hypothetical protein
MKVVTYLDEQALKNPKVGAILARKLLQAIVLGNRYYLHTHPNTPLLYESGVRYKREPNAFIYEEFADIPHVLKRGWGDCDDLVAWRCAEIQHREKRPCDPLIYWRQHPNGSGSPITIWHVQVRRQDTGEVEDPSRLLGM